MPPPMLTIKPHSQTIQALLSMVKNARVSGIEVRTYYARRQSTMVWRGCVQVPSLWRFSASNYIQ